MLFDESSSRGGMGLREHDEGGGRTQDDHEPTSGHCIHHDQWLTPASPALTALSARLFDDIEQHCLRPKRQRSDARERRRVMVDNLLANFVLLGPRRGSFAVSARNRKATRYDRHGFRAGTLVGVISDLEERGWLAWAPGVAHKARTLLDPTPKLSTALLASGATVADLERLPGAETIILKADAGRGRPKPLIDYQDTPETAAMRADMETINATLRAADLRFGGEIMPPPHLVRIFQIGSPDALHGFTAYGRLYRGFWQTLPRGQRYLLTINGEAVADLDYRAMFVHLAYAYQGAPPPDGDPYAIPGLEHHREAVKKSVSALFSRTGPIRRLSPELRALLPEGWTAERLMGAISDRHPAIAPLLGADIAPTFTRTESDIMVDVLQRLAERGIVALPMHDGLLVGVSNRAEAVEAMQEISALHIGRTLTVETKRVAER